MITINHNDRGITRLCREYVTEGGLKKTVKLKSTVPLAFQKSFHLSFVCSLILTRHMKEISELQAFQRSEIERLYKELGRTLPPNVGLLHAAPPSGRRRRASKHKLKAGKLLNPMVQQLKNNLNTTAERKGVYVYVCG